MTKQWIWGLIGAAALAGCATAGSGGGNDTGSLAHPTSFSKPTEMSRIEFQKDPAKYSKSWTDTITGSLDAYKKITIPVYSIDFQTFAAKADQSKFAAAFVKDDGAKNVLTMKVAFPWEDHKGLLQEIVDASYVRLKAKFQKIGLEVVEWPDVKAKYEEAREFEKEKLNVEPVRVNGNAVSFAAPGKGRLDSIFWMASASSLSREAGVVVVLPSFAVGFGYFGGEKTPQTIGEAHGYAGIQFTPQIQVLTGSGVMTAAKYEGGRILLDKTMVSKEPIASGLTKWGDTRASADRAAANIKSAVAGYNGTTNDRVAVSTDASVDYAVNIDPARYKTALLAELEAAEDLIVQRYKMELD